MENREYLNSLFDIYGDLLTEIEKETFINYYHEDLSLSEIADNRNISKSSVGKSLSSAEEKLKEYESILNNLAIKEKIKEAIKEVENIDILKGRITEILDK